MIYFTPHEHAVACIAFMFLGAFFGVLYRSTNTLARFISQLLHILPDVLKATAPTSNKTLRQDNKPRHLLDFLFFLIFGISYILFSYITLDGEFRIYYALISAISFTLFEKVLSIPIEYVLRFAFENVYRVIFFITYILTLPFKGFFNLIKKLITPHINNLRHKIYKKSFRSFVKKECKTIEQLICEIK